MTPEEQIKKLETEKAELETQLAAANETIAQKDTEIEGLNKTVSEKDEIIEQKNQDIIGARRKYKKLDELSDEERANMTEAEIEAKKDQDALYEEQQAGEKQRQDDRQREINERKQAAIKKIAGDDQELATKISEKFDRIKDSDKAYTEGEIGAFAQEAFNMLGTPAPQPVRQAVNNQEGVAPVIGNDGTGGFADSAEGKSLGESLGLASAGKEIPAEGGGEGNA